MKYDIQKNYTSLKQRKTETERELKEFLEKTIITEAQNDTWIVGETETEREGERERERMKGAYQYPKAETIQVRRKDYYCNKNYDIQLTHYIKNPTCAAVPVLPSTFTKFLMDTIIIIRTTTTIETQFEAYSFGQDCTRAAGGM